MNLNIKEVFYNNKVYSVPVTTLKHINKLDVVRIDEKNVVFYSEPDRAWKKADLNLEQLYDNNKAVVIKKDDEVINTKITLDSILEVMDKKVAKVKLDAVIVCVDETKNEWEVLPTNTELYKLFSVFDVNRNKLGK